MIPKKILYACFLMVSMFLSKPLSALHVEPKNNPNPGIINQNEDDCFFSASLQILTNLPLLDDLFSGNNYVEDSIPGQIVHFQNALRTFNESIASALGYDVIDPKTGKSEKTYGSANLRNYIVTNSKKIHIKNMAIDQQDAQEFLSELFAFLSEDSKGSFENQEIINTILEHHCCSNDVADAFKLRMETRKEQSLSEDFIKKQFNEIIQLKKTQYNHLLEIKATVDENKKISELKEDEQRNIFARSGINKTDSINGTSILNFSLINFIQKLVELGKVLEGDDAKNLSLKINNANWSDFLNNLTRINTTSSLVKNIFEIMLESELTCNICNQKTSTNDPSWLLSLSIDESSTDLSIEQLLKNFLSREEILDGDNEVWCESCSNLTEKTRTFSIKKFPQILVLSPKRFKQTVGGGLRKIDTKISCPENLSLDKSGLGIFHLVGAVHQHGGLGFGHYTAYVKDLLTKEWFHYNDANRTPIDLATAIQPTKSGYIFFYVQNDSASKPYIPSPSSPKLEPHPVPSKPMPTTSTPATDKPLSSTLPSSPSSKPDSTIPPTSITTPKPVPTPTDPLTKKLVALKTSLQELEKKLTGLKGTLEKLRKKLL